ncbi:MAG: AsnC family transcriptional regulator [Nitrosopumilales archaeon]|nr:AsnC family transcriptional regulator [Nitrosopumilales archaeon]
MPQELDQIDIAILNSLIEDGRKSFRQIGREIKISTPTVQARYRRLVNLGFIKSVSPVLDMSKLDKKYQKEIKSISQTKSKLPMVKDDDKLSVKVSCDFCEQPIHGSPKVIKFGEYERFFCCTSCRSLYKEKYGGRIHSLSNEINEF